MECDLNEFLVEKWEALQRFRREERKELKKMSGREIDQMVAKEAREYMKIPSIKFRKNQVMQNKQREEEHRQRMQIASCTLTQHMKHRKTQ